MTKPKFNNNDEPVTLVFEWKVKKGKEEAFEKWAHEATQTASQFEGHLGTNWIKPAANNRNYTLIYKFNTLDNFKKWEQSETRKKLLQRGLELSPQDKPKKLQEITGLETWFTLPGSMTIKPPPKWKMALATIMGALPTALTFQILFAPIIKDMHVLPRTIMLVSFMITLMTFVVMPNITKLLKGWLYPEK